MLGLTATKVYFLLHVRCGLVMALLRVIFAPDLTWWGICYLKCWQPSWRRVTEATANHTLTLRFLLRSDNTHIPLLLTFHWPKQFTGLHLISMGLRDLIFSRKGQWLCFNKQSTTSQDDSWVSGLKSSPNWSTRQKAMRECSRGRKVPLIDGLLCISTYKALLVNFND